jgi:tetratricopeptide (TPR) repeat protein
MTSINNFGLLLHAQDKLAQAEPLFREALERRRRVLGDDHPNTLTSINNMGLLFQAQGKPDQAEPLWREALERLRRVLGDDHPNTLSLINNIGYLLMAQGKLEQAEPVWREALQGRRSVLGDDHPETLGSINNLARLLQRQGKLADAQPLFEQLYRRAGVVPLPPKQAALYVCRYGLVLTELGKHEEAVEPLGIAYQRLKSAGMETVPEMRAVAAALAAVCDETGRSDEAAKWRSELAALEAAPGDRKPTTQLSRD